MNTKLNKITLLKNKDKRNLNKLTDFNEYEKYKSKNDKFWYYLKIIRRFLKVSQMIYS